MSERRTQEQNDNSAPSGLRWFELKAALAALGNAEAYPTSWSRTQNQWIRDTNSPVRTIHSTLAGISGSIGDFVLCYLNPAGRKWEVIRPKPVSVTPSLYYYAYRAVEGFGPDVPGFGTACLDTTNQSGFSGAEFVCGNETEVGILFDSADTTPSTNGNFRITKAGTYRIEMTGTYKIRTGNTGSSAVQDLLVKCDLQLNGVLFSQIRDFQKFQWQQDSGDYYVQMSAVGVIYLNVGARLAFRWQMSATAAIATGTLVALGSGVCPFIIVTRLSDEDMLSNNAPTPFP